MRRIIFSIVSLAFAFCGGYANCAPTPVKKPCAEVATELPLLNYGVKVPQGWSCVATLSSVTSTYSLVTLEKSNKRVIIAENDLLPVGSASNPEEKEWVRQLPGFGEKEPAATVRYFTELFLNDPKVIGQSEIRTGLVKNYQPKPKGILFSKNNDRIVVYENNGQRTFKGKTMSNQHVMIIRKADANKYLGLTFEGCTDNDVFTLAINPAIQQ